MYLYMKVGQGCDDQRELTISDLFAFYLSQDAMRSFSL